MNLTDERRLLEQAATDPEAFGALFDAYYPAILRYIIKRTGDMGAAQDIVSETFLKAYQNLSRFTWQDVSIINWFYKIAINELRTYFRRGTYAPRSLEELHEHDGFDPIDPHNLADELVLAQDRLLRQEQFLQAQRLLATLPLKYQEVISLRFLEHKKLSDIALILGKSENTVKTLLYRGLAILRRQMSENPMKLRLGSRVIDNEDHNSNGVPEIV